MFAVRSPDHGATWGVPVQLTDTPGSSDHGSILGAGQAVFLAWHDSRSGVLEIRYSHSVDEGMTWIADEKVSTSTTTEASTPLLATSADYVHALWLDKRTGPYQIMYRRRERPTVPAAGDLGTVDGTVDGAPDASMTGDAGLNSETGDDSGCGCTTATRPRALLAPLGLAALVGLGLRRRKRR